MQITAFPRPSCVLYLADAAAIKVRIQLGMKLYPDPPPTLDNQEVTSSRAKFPKPVHLYTPLTVFGINIVASEGEEWKKFRKIVAPTFSEVRSEHVRRLSTLKRTFQRNNKLVWDETIGIMNDLFDNVWGDKSEVVVDHCMDITIPVRTFLAYSYSSANISPRSPSSSSALQVVFVLFESF